MKLLSSAVVLAAFAVAIFIYFSREPAISSPPPVAAPASAVKDCPQCAQLSEQIDTLQRNLIAMKAQLAAQQSQSAAAREGHSAKLLDSHDDRNDVVAMRAADAERRREYMAGVAQSFAAERIDGNWASYASTRVSAALSGDETLRSVAQKVECRQQTCRLELADDGSGNLSSRMPVLAMALADIFPTMAAEQVEQGNGSAMVFYLSKQPPGAPSR